ncbi:cell pole-organizing protein PopZ [Novosphingobium chloroacetimidivorans]|uniref:Cell pole-organizing protein PopZ n=1 Tax=Novosphingobium chloroacetimidivorans TaxID=1428314 RepID=A0A7W7NV45_9SPHN|nr:DUF2497 domain-containing protein [Novosphingobium chloroacetimidivorans]MBB4857841.1 cell pole-organizing protein PopZ [Novosphingobium chloroacetimidivorans]
MKQNGEPSVEEILASIKQVIARDTRVGTAYEAVRREPVTSAPAESHAQAHVQAHAQAHPGPDPADDVLELAESDSVAIDHAGPDEISPLLTEGTRAAMRDSLAALAAISGPGAAPQIVRSGETSLEGLVREMLRPALSEWLDKHLPSLVERLVAAEIARIVGKKL